MILEGEDFFSNDSCPEFFFQSSLAGNGWFQTTRRHIQLSFCLTCFWSGTLQIPQSSILGRVLNSKSPTEKLSHTNPTNIPILRDQRPICTKKNLKRLSQGEINFFISPTPMIMLTSYLIYSKMMNVTVTIDTEDLFASFEWSCPIWVWLEDKGFIVRGCNNLTTSVTLLDNRRYRQNQCVLSMLFWFVIHGRFA